jgi:hypothetical protein
LAQYNRVIEKPDLAGQALISECVGSKLHGICIPERDEVKFLAFERYCRILRDMVKEVPSTGEVWYEKAQSHIDQEYQWALRTRRKILDSLSIQESSPDLEEWLPRNHWSPLDLSQDWLPIEHTHHLTNLVPGWLFSISNDDRVRAYYLVRGDTYSL